MGVSLKLEPGATARHNARTIILLLTNLLGIEVHAVTTNQLRHNYALGTIHDKGTAVSHPWILAHVQLGFLNLAGCTIN